MCYIPPSHSGSRHYARYIPPPFRYILAHGFIFLSGFFSRVSLLIHKCVLMAHVGWDFYTTSAVLSASTGFIGRKYVTELQVVFKKRSEIRKEGQTQFSEVV